MKITINIKTLEQLIAAAALDTIDYFEKNGMGEIPYGELYHYPIERFWKMIREEYNIKEI